MGSGTGLALCDPQVNKFEQLQVMLTWDPYPPPPPEQTENITFLHSDPVGKN